MDMREVTDAPETLPIRAGRYLMPLARRWTLTVWVAGYLGYSSWNWARTPGLIVGWEAGAAITVYAVVLVLAVKSWFVPVTVVDQWGIHRQTGRPRHIPWADVAGFLVVRTWRFARVEIQLPSARNVRLLGVPVAALRVAPDGPSALDLFQPRKLAPSRPTDPTDDPWRTRAR